MARGKLTFSGVKTVFPAEATGIFKADAPKTFEAEQKPKDFSSTTVEE